MKVHYLILVITAASFVACQRASNSSENISNAEISSDSDTTAFPTELVDFYPISENPVFKGTDIDTWDERIRERGYILKEGDTYHMWYTGYPQTEDRTLYLGYATSNDGLEWTRYIDNPVFDESWTEDMMVMKLDSTYHMFAEGKNDIAHRLTSNDRINWTDHGSLNIRYTNALPLSEGPYGTPTAWFENNTWYLFYERGDLGIWLATSEDLEIWTNVQDDPIIEMGPESYDQYGLAVNQIVKYKGWYYAY